MLDFHWLIEDFLVQSPFECLNGSFKREAKEKHVRKADISHSI